MKKVCPITFEDIASIENICEAWQEFIRGKRKKEDVRAFARHLADEIVCLHDDLVAGAYCHGPYIHFRIQDPKPRDIHKATVRDLEVKDFQVLAEPAVSDHAAIVAEVYRRVGSRDR